MSAITAFLLVGLSALPFAYLQRNCTNFPAIQNFDHEAYFSGTWYVTHSSPDVLGLCLSIRSNIQPRIVRELYRFQKPELTVYAEGFISRYLFKNSVGKYVTEMRLIKITGEPLMLDLIPVEKTIIDTNYMNYSVIAICGDGQENEFEVMGRLPYLELLEPLVDGVLKTIGMNLSNFYSTENLYCPKIDY